MYVLDTKEQSVIDKKLFSALQNFAQNECVPFILKNELKETYSIVRKGHKTKPK